MPEDLEAGRQSGLNLSQAMIDRIAVLERTLSERHDADLRELRAYIATLLENAEKMAQTRLHGVNEQIKATREKIENLDELTDAKFATQVAMITNESSKAQAAVAANAQQVRLQLEASDKAITKAEQANETRMASMNEFRAQAADRDRFFATKETVDAIVQRADRERDENRQALERLRLQQGEFLTRETSEAQIQVANAAYADLAKQINSLDRAQSRIFAYAAAFATIIGLVSILLNLILRLSHG